MNYYFEYNEPEFIEDIEILLSLNVKKYYYAPGNETPINDISSIYFIPHQTSGIFRGQLNDWPLVPKCFRTDSINDKESSEMEIAFAWTKAMTHFDNFCERAKIHNPTFPPNIIDQMSIAQHFGIPTPLLDWSRNIFTAIFFAARDVFNDESFKNSLKIYIYHIADERLLEKNITQTITLDKLDESAFVEPYFIDRRIERQRGAFTFHPHPARKPKKIPVKVYVLEWGIISKLKKLMKGFGFTEDYFFPDYAGIAHAVMSSTFF